MPAVPGPARIPGYLPLMDPFQTRTAILTEIRPLARDTNLYVMDLNEPLPFEAGQFVNIGIPNATPRPERSYSIWSDPGQPGRMEFAIKLFEGGQASEYFRVTPVGTQFTLKGPYGHFQLRPPEENEGAHWFFATSTGLAPFHAMLCVAAREQDRRKFRILFGNRDEGDIFGLDRLEALQSQLNLEYTVCLSKPGDDLNPAYRRGRITAHLPEINLSDRYYLCGNGTMITEAKDLLKAAGVDRKRIHYEKYW